MTTALDTPPAVLAPTLEAHARRYIAARTRSGDALLEAVAALADARAAAAHGEWGIFLAAVGLDDSRARALIRLHDACLTDRALADRVRSGWLSEAAARELLPAPADVRAAVLDAAEPPTLADVREAKRAATPDLPPPEPDLADILLYQPGGELYSTTKQLDPQLKTLSTFEAGALKRAAERTQASGPTSHLPEGWAEAQRRAEKIGLHLTMNALGQFKLADANGAIVGSSVFGGADGWKGMLAELARKETQTPCYRSPTRIDTGALGTLGTRLTETTDPRELATTYRAIGLLLAAGGVLPALPTRPRAPRSADVSEQLAYLGQLETYVEALERRAGVRP